MCAWMMHFHVDAVKQLLGKLTAFPVTFFLIQRLTEPILANFGLKPFQPKRGKANTCSSYEHGHFVMSAMRFYCTYKVPQESTAREIVGRNEQERKGKRFHSKQSKK